MNQGTWHQCCDRSQKLVIEQLENNVGVGVIISPRDLAEHKAAEYAPVYQGHGAEVIFDTQFYIPDSTVGKLSQYEQMAEFRTTATSLHGITDDELTALTAELVRLNQTLGTDAVLAPAVVYEAGQPQIEEINTRLHLAAQAAATELGLPLYATIALGRSATSSDTTINAALNHATTLIADGWYYAYEFDPGRLPTSQADVYRCLRAGLRLSLTESPVIHAYAGPLGLLSSVFGATGIGVGHSQNTWHFTRGRWEPVAGGGGGGDAPARLWSEALWGTIIHPDETQLLDAELRDEVVTESPYLIGWDRWKANKHLVHVIGTTVQEVRDLGTGFDVAETIEETLQVAVDNHESIQESGLYLKDNSNEYQETWKNALVQFVEDNEEDLELLDDLA